MQLVTINSLKFDGSIHRSWRCRLIEETSDYWLFVGTFDVAIRHDRLGLIRPGTESYEYYWKNEWFNVFRFHEPEGEFRFYYCNINMPPRLANGILEYVDLDIDVLVKPDFEITILDEDEYAQNSSRFGYPAAIEDAAAKAVEDLLALIDRRQFPFDVDPSATR